MVCLTGCRNAYTADPSPKRGAGRLQGRFPLPDDVSSARAGWMVRVFKKPAQVGGDRGNRTRL
jgi:hypothetical protein